MMRTLTYLYKGARKKSKLVLGCAQMFVMPSGRIFEAKPNFILRLSTFWLPVITAPDEQST